LIARPDGSLVVDAVARRALANDGR
jgi:hypothetical protein